MAPISGHFLFEYYIEGAWRILDFDQKAYYRTTNGEIASYKDLVADPYLVFHQKTYGPLAPEFQDYSAAVILQGLEGQSSSTRSRQKSLI